jgi:hypothetical protein
MVKGVSKLQLMAYSTSLLIFRRELFSMDYTWSTSTHDPSGAHSFISPSPSLFLLRLIVVVVRIGVREIIQALFPFCDPSFYRDVVARIYGGFENCMSAFKKL